MMRSMVELKGVSKAYGPVKALDDLSLNIKAGEVHALLGENGAGKSTAMKIIRGEIAPSDGQVLIDGSPVSKFSPRRFDGYGIAMVHQELAIFDTLSVAENILPGSPHRDAFGFIRKSETRARAAELLDLFSLDLDPAQPMSTLTTGQKQTIEIARAVSDDRRLIVLDEPTSSLNAHETEILLELIKSLRARGKSILFVSHRISEVLEISDRITVLRDGRSVETLENRDLSETDLVTRMVGREVNALQGARRSSTADPSVEMISVSAFEGHGRLKPTDLCLHKGEILGVFGLEGSGTTELSRLIFGLDYLKSGDLKVRGKTVVPLNPQNMIDLGVTYLSANRAEAGLFPSRPLAETVSAPVLQKTSRFGAIDLPAEAELAESFRGAFGIKAESLKSPPSSLSGGNQQKVMLAACLSPSPTILVANDPTRGVDVGAKEDMHRVIVDIAEAGAGVLIFSSELPELLRLCDRLLIMRDGKIVGELKGAELSESVAMTIAAAEGH